MNSEGFGFGGPCDQSLNSLTGERHNENRTGTFPPLANALPAEHQLDLRMAGH
jgi:hypothetical protein